MTTRELARSALPYVRDSLKSARPAVVDEIGYAGMIAIWPAWAVITGPLLPLLVRIAIELAIGLTAPRLLPVLDVLLPLIRSLPAGYVPPADREWFAELVSLMKTPRSQMHDVVQATLRRSRDELGV